MITSTILTILLGFVYLLDILLGSILPLQKGTAMFGYILSLMDNIVFYVRSILPLTISTIFFYAKQNGWQDELSVTREVDKRYLEANDVLSDKSVCVTISPQGTGKTEAISKALEGEDKVLLVGHRRNLIKQASKRLNLSCYLEESYTSSKASRVGICLDSILKTKKQAIGGTLVIDEWTQVLRHITGSTLKRKRAAVLAFFVDILKASTKIILLDAIADESLLNLLLSFSNKTLEDTEITRL